MYDRRQFLEMRVAALRDSIQRHKDMINLYTLVQDVNADKQADDLAELQRRIDLDQKLLAEREAELGSL